VTHGSLFSGIGGFDLAAAVMGWENVFQCERDAFCQRVLRFYWPNARLYEDIRKFDATGFRGRVGVLSGGFPCQPFSVAGKRKGVEDDRYLWPEMCRIIREVRPRWVVGENVPGLVNWGRGLVFEQVLADMGAEGYEAWPVILPAAGVGAPHRRERIWFIAHAGREPGNGREGPADGRNRDREGAGRQQTANVAGGLCTEGPATYTHGDECPAGTQREGRAGKPTPADGGKANVSDTHGQQRREGGRDAQGPKVSGQYPGTRPSWNARGTWENFPTQPPLRSRNDGVSARLDGIAFPKWCAESIRGGGNAIVPQVAVQLFTVIEQVEGASR
jgi:DNA (cytosine-5)-methyltransferase 1